MKAPTGSKSDHEPPPVALRPEQPDDENWLFNLYASTREEELAMTNWSEPMRRAFLDQQFNAMRQAYRSMFPAGEFSIIELGGQPVGRMVVHRAATEIRVVDIALLPAYRNRGIGTFLMRQACTEATKAGQPVRLHVLKNNRASGWYKRLGFDRVGKLGFYDELEWRPVAGDGLTSAAG